MAAADARSSLGEMKQLLHRQRVMMDQQEQALAALERRLKEH